MEFPLNIESNEIKTDMIASPKHNLIAILPILVNSSEIISDLDNN
jgi:hypothetical protein